MHDNEVREMSIDVQHSEDYNPEYLTIGTAYIRDMVDAPNKYPLHLAGTVYQLPLDGKYETLLYELVKKIGLPTSMISEDEFGNSYLWVIGE